MTPPFGSVSLRTRYRTGVRCPSQSHLSRVPGNPMFPYRSQPLPIRYGCVVPVVDPEPSGGVDGPVPRTP